MTPTIITSSKGRLAHLKQSLPTWLEHTPCEIIVVTAACPDHTGAWVLDELKSARAYAIEAALERYDPRAAPFNKPICLNTGAMAGENFLLFLDADTLVMPGFWPWLEPRVSGEQLFYVAPTMGSRNLTGVLGVSAAAFHAVGGFDEKMIGWGSEDLDIRLRLYLSGEVEPTEIPPGLLDSIPHDDDLRTRFYDEKDKMASHLRNLQRLVDNAERITGKSIFALLESDPNIERLFRVPYP